MSNLKIDTLLSKINTCQHVLLIVPQSMLFVQTIFFLPAGKQLRGNTVQYTISRVLSYYFAKALHKQKIELDNMLFILILLIHIC